MHLGPIARRILAGVVGTALAASPLLAAPVAAEPDPAIVSVDAPSVSGTPVFGATLTAAGGTWDPADAELTYAWLRDGTIVGTGATYALTHAADVHRTFVVRVTAAKAGFTSASADSSATARVERATVTNTKLPYIVGTPKFRKTLKLSVGRWSIGGLTFKYRWLRDGKAIRGATKKSYVLQPADVGTRISARVSAKRTGYTSVLVTSKKTRTIQHLRPVRKTVTYRIATRGKITASVATFRRQAAATFADPRGWRGMGVAFKEVKKGGDFTLYLSQASKVPSFSSGCSSTYSCRVGRNVIINQTRWLKASPAWKANKGTVRNYRHLVVNHETGHWLGKGHASCSGNGDLAGVMQQQSKGLHGCKINPWPKTGELHAPRFGF